jgi:cold shock CspA family protein
MLGTVIWYSEIKGYGFIRVDGAPNGSLDYFVHHSVLPAANGRKFLLKAQRVQFEAMQREGKLCARDVRPLDEGGDQ